MYQRIQILHSKLLPPRSSDTIRRERLYHLLDEIPGKRLATVIAGAGFGKTTLIAEAEKRLGMNTLWYRLDNSDRDFVTFITYLITGISKYIPELGTLTSKRIEEARNLSREREAVLSVFLSEIEQLIKKDIIIALDDYHLIRDSREIKESLKYLLKYFPPQVHIVLISRTDPLLPISSLRARRDVIDIKEKDLCFNINEIYELYIQLFGISLTKVSLKNIHRKTGGWISGIILFYHSIRGKTHEEIEELLLQIKGSQGIISNYLEENVYDEQTDEVKKFLINTSILSRLKADICDPLLGIHNSRDIMKSLEENHLFTYPINEEREWYYYHHLFQEFLQKKLIYKLEKETLLNLHKNAAILWEKQGDEKEALTHFLQAEQFEKARVILRKLGMEFIKEGRTHLVNLYINKMPRGILRKDPWIQYIQAMTLELSGKAREAEEIYKKAYKIFGKLDIPEGAELCLHRLGYNYFIAGNLPGAEKKLRELLLRVKDNSPLCVDILGHLISISANQTKMTAADKYYKEAEALLGGLEDKERLARITIHQGLRYCISGDFTQALELGEQAKETCESMELYHLLVMNYHLISLSYYGLGQFERGMANAVKGINLVKERGFHDITRVFILTAAAFNAAALGRTEEAINDARESLSNSENMGSPWLQAMASMALYDACVKSGDLLKAEECAASGLMAIDGLKLPVQEGGLKLGLAYCYIKKRQWKHARAMLEDAEKYFKKSKLFLSQTYLMYAGFFWERKNREAALNKLISALRLSEKNHYDTRIVSEKHWIVPPLVEIYARGKMQRYIKKIIGDIGLYAGEELTLLENNKNPGTRDAVSVLLGEILKAPPPGLRVYCLGGFRVFRGDEEILPGRWKSKKAKLLFKYLSYSRGRGYLPKDLLMEILWPEEDPKRVAHRLHVALNSLRNILDPEIYRGNPSSFYILREEDSYQLNLGDDGWVDVDEFERELKLAKEERTRDKAIEHYLNAEAAYSGNYLEEDLYAEWCFDERERLKDEYLDLLTGIMKYYERKEDYSRCIEYARKYLDKDKYAENIYQQLMRYYSLTGNKAMAVRTFEKYRRNITSEMGNLSIDEFDDILERLFSIN